LKAPKKGEHGNRAQRPNGAAGAPRQAGESQRSTDRSNPTTMPVNAVSAKARAIGRYFQCAFV